MTNDDWERVRDEAYRRADEWIEAERDFEDAKASGNWDEITAADETVYETAMAVAEPVLGEVLRRRMWREIEPCDDLSRDENGSTRLEMHRKFLIDTVDLGLREVTDPYIHAAWRMLEKLWDSR